MNVYGEQIRTMRESMNNLQMKFTQIFNWGQSSVVRYEKGEASPPLELLVRLLISLMYLLITFLSAPTISKVSSTSTNRRTVILQTWLTLWKCASIPNLP